MRTGDASRHVRGRRRQRGFTYLWLLFAVVLSGVALAAIGERATVATQRDKEAELEFRGEAIKHAIAAYWNGSPGETKTLPRTLEELAEDRRGSTTVRHLRRVYDDPFTGASDWELLRAPDGEGLVGVRSRSPLPAYKIVGMPPAPLGTVRKISDRLFQFEDAASQPTAAASAGQLPEPRRRSR